MLFTHFAIPLSPTLCEAGLTMNTGSAATRRMVMRRKRRRRRRRVMRRKKEEEKEEKKKEEDHEKVYEDEKDKEDEDDCIVDIIRGNVCTFCISIYINISVYLGVTDIYNFCKTENISFNF